MRVLVVGAGVVGASAAYHLTESGADVLVVDRGEPGQATAAGAGVVFPYQLAPEPTGWEPLVAGTVAHWSDVVDPLGDDAGVATVRMIHVDGDERALDQTMELLDGYQRRQAGPQLPPFERLPPGGPAAEVPVLHRDLGGIAARGARRVNGRTLRDRLLALAVERGAEHRTGSVGLAIEGDRVAATVDGERTGADAAVVAAGAWSAQACHPLGLQLPVTAVRGQILHVDVPDPTTGQWPIVRAWGRHYLLGFAGGRVVCGATHEPGAGYDHRVTAGGAHHVLGNALDVAPGLADATVAEIRVGFRPVSADGLPVLGTVDGLGGLVVATGLGANGLTFGPYAGAVAADLALGHDPPAGFGSFAPQRPATADAQAR